MNTIEHRLSENSGIGKGFDFLRVFLSFSVLFVHSHLIVTGNQAVFEGGLAKVFHQSLLQMFFALSGFLIAGSATRLSLRNFLLNRGFRIFPALAMDIFISALVIGPIFTMVSFSAYFSDRQFFGYFANLFGLVHYTLPGVFIDNPFPEAVNGSLWTVPFELGCYALISFLIATRFIRSKVVLSLFVLSFAVSLLILQKLDINLLANSKISIFQEGWFQRAIHHFVWPERSWLYVYFLMGCLVYVLSAYIIRNKIVLLLAIAAVLLRTTGFYGPYASIVTVLPLVYMTIYIGTMRIPPLPIFSRGDYSYGIYLYGFPVQQALISIFQSSFSPLTHFMMSAATVTPIAMLSWHYFEKPILQYRKKFSMTARLTSASGYAEYHSQKTTKAQRRVLSKV